MKIFVWDVPTLIVAGAVLGYLRAKVFCERKPDAYFHISFWLMLPFWLNVLFSNIGVIDVWLVGGSRWIVDVPAFVGVFYSLSYLFWYLWGSERAYQVFGRTPYQAGMLWAFRLKDKSKPFEPPWKEKSASE